MLELYGRSVQVASPERQFKSILVQVDIIHGTRKQLRDLCYQGPIFFCNWKEGIGKTTFNGICPRNDSILDSISLLRFIIHAICINIGSLTSKYYPIYI